MSQNLPAHREDHTPAPAANVIYAYPITPPPQQSLTDSTQRFMQAMAILTEAADKVQAVLRLAYPCAICQEDLAGLTAWQQRYHFRRHPLRDQARVVGWARAVMGT